MIYKMSPGAGKFALDCSLTQNKAKEVIKERRAALQDTVSTGNISETYIKIEICALKATFRIYFGILQKAVRYHRARGEDSHMKWTGVLVGNFEFNP